MGNFFTDALTTAYPIGEIDPWTGITYYLFDGVEVLPLDGCHTLGLTEGQATQPLLSFIGNSMQIQWNEKVFHVMLMDAAGRTIGQGSTNIGSMEMPLSEAGGMYFLRLKGGSRSFVQKFIVQ